MTTDADVSRQPLRFAFRQGLGWYPLTALGTLLVVDYFQGYAVVVLGPEISRSLGISKTVLAGLLSLKILALTLATLPVAAWVQRRPRRGLVCIVTAFGWSLTTLFTGWVVLPIGLAVVLLVDGITSGSVQAVHRPLLLDCYPVGARVRVLSAYRAFDNLGNILAPLAVGLCTAILPLTWRGTFIALGVVCVLASFVSIRLRDPGFGRYDELPATERVTEAALAEVSDDDRLSDDDVQLGFFEIMRRLLLIPTVRRVLAGEAVLGMMLVPLNTYLIFFLDERWRLGPGGRAVFFAVMPVFSIVALAGFGKRGERLFHQNPGRLLDLCALVLGAGVAALGLAVVAPVFVVMSLLFGTAFACIAMTYPMLETALLSVVPAEQRPHAAALAGVALAAVGGVGGLLLLGSVDSTLGTAGAIASISIPGVAAGLVLRTARHTVAADLARLAANAVEESEVHAARLTSGEQSLLACRHIDFSYGQLQVLFDVDFTVDAGEMIALLGTNGAGKSTLLRVVSGLGLPSSGSVRYRGADITYIDAERRVRLGITQVPGGKAVFGPLSVAENLRIYGVAHGRSRAALTSGIDAAFEAFPRLAERRNAPASTMSGGEQQMLALSKALILRPRLLLIDELSLGLAPKVVGELLAMVRTINSSGTSVVLVEQSVNVALSLVQRAYFMEKGQVRFEGPASDLLERPDLLRSVFLEGAAAGLSTQ